MKALSQSYNEHSFTCHKQSGYIGFVIAMIVITLLESAGVSYLLYNWSPLLHWLHLSICVSVIVFLAADLRGILQNPISIKNDKVSMKIGMRPKVVIDLDRIQELLRGSINFEKDRKDKDVLDLSLLGFDEPTFELVLNDPIESKGLLGNIQMIRRIFLTVDQKEEFYSLIKEKQALREASQDNCAATIEPEREHSA